MAQFFAVLLINWLGATVYKMIIHVICMYLLLQYILYCCSYMLCIYYCVIVIKYINQNNINQLAKMQSSSPVQRIGTAPKQIDLTSVFATTAALLCQRVIVNKQM